MLVERYEIRDVIGAGGMGMVYLGHDTHTGQEVALKLLKAEAVRSDPAQLERFIREGEALRQLNHPGIVKVLDTFEVENSHFIVMEYVPGGSLKSLLRQQPQLPVARVLEITLDLADALARAHRLRIIHRDIKPANVLLAEDGTPRLADFGVAYIEAKERVTMSGVAMGTTDYISPEALNGEPVDARADIWSLGVMMFEMIAGRRPFQGDTTPQVLLAIMTEITPDLEELRPDCPVDLADLVYRMLEKDRDARIPSVRLVGAEVEALLHGLSHDSARVISTRFPPLHPNSDPPTAPLHPVRNNLPAQTTPFIGREPELDEIARLVADPHIRLVTILAPGGMGKTRLAQEAAERHLNAFPDGVYFVELAPLINAGAILPAIAEALRYPFADDERPPLQQLLDFLREKTMLLVLDNFEHVLDGADLVNSILEAAPLVQLITTSRARLNLRSETVLPLDGMDFPDFESASDAMQYSAVRLFMQSARREDPGFTLHDDDLRHVARICRLLQGMPLGILLAAAWVDTLSLAEIADEISRSLDFLASDMRDLPERHQSIRAVFDYSWSLLAAKEREAFARLAVFRGGTTRHAAQEITGAALRTLMALVDKSLLRRDPASGRYEIHELLRQYAAEQLEKMGELNAIRQAHAAYYAAAGGGLESDLKGRRQLAALNEIEADFDNGRAAWEWAVEQKQGELIDQALQSLFLYCNMRSRWHTVDAMFQAAIDCFAPAPGQVASALYGRLLARYYKQNADAACVSEALEIARSHDDPLETAFCLYALGWAQYVAGDYDAALKHYEASLTLYESLNDEYFIAVVYASLGVWYARSGQVERALRYFQHSLEMRRKMGDRVGMADALHHIGAPLIFRGHLSEAEKYTQEAFNISQETGSLSDIAFSGATLAGLALWRGDLDVARRLIETSLSIANDIHHAQRRGYALAIMGNLAYVEGDYEQARQLCEQARPLAAANPLVAYIADIGLANAACGLGDFAAARQPVQAALRTVLALRNRALMTACLPAMAALLGEDGQPARAVELLALAFGQPDAAAGWLWKWPLLREMQAALATELGSAAYQAAWDRGAAQDIESVVAGLVAGQV